MLARIYRPARSATQSGKAKSEDWLLEFEPASARLPDPLMGWAQSSDPDGQVRLSFASREEAVAYAEARGIPFQVAPDRTPKRIIKAYADNFAADRRFPWTH
jgi:hypothetical protein